MVVVSSEVKSLGLKLDIEQEISTEADGIILTTETRTDSKMILTNQLESLKDLESLADDFTFEQEADQYVLTLAGDDKKINEYVKSSLPTNIPELEKAMKSMTLEDVEYEIFIDKKLMNVDMNIGVSENGNSLV